MSMTSRERLLRTLRRQPVDRVPVSTYELVGWNRESWENQQPAYASLMQYIRERTDCLYMIGFASPNRAAEITVEEWDEGPRRVRRHTMQTPRGPLTSLDYREAGLNTTWRTERWLKSDEDVERFLSVPRQLDMPDMSRLATVNVELGEHGILLVSVGDPICLVAELFEFSDFMLRAHQQPRQIDALLDHVAPSIYAHLDYLLEHGAGPLFRVVGAEYCTPPYLPPALFERFVVRYTAPMIERIRASGGFARVHCHGRIRQALPMIIEMGADGLDPVEGPPSGDIPLAQVKRLYGDRLTLFGNIQLRDLETLPAEDMRRVVRETVEAGMPGGGFVLMPTAAPINADLSPLTERNYRIMIDTALEYGQYA